MLVRLDKSGTAVDLPLLAENGVIGTGLNIYCVGRVAKKRHREEQVDIRELEMESAVLDSALGSALYKAIKFTAHAKQPEGSTAI